VYRALTAKSGSVIPVALLNLILSTDTVAFARGWSVVPGNSRYWRAGAASRSPHCQRYRRSRAPTWLMRPGSDGQHHR